MTETILSVGQVQAVCLFAGLVLGWVGALMWVTRMPPQEKPSRFYIKEWRDECTGVMKRKRVEMPTPPARPMP